MLSNWHKFPWPVIFRVDISIYVISSEVKVFLAQSCLTLFDHMDCNLSGFSVRDILPARILEWLAIPSPGDPPDSGIKPVSPALQADSLLSEPPGKSI